MAIRTGNCVASIAALAAIACAQIVEAQQDPRGQESKREPLKQERPAPRQQPARQPQQRQQQARPRPQPSRNPQPARRPSAPQQREAPQRRSAPPQQAARRQAATQAQRRASATQQRTQTARRQVAATRATQQRQRAAQATANRRVQQSKNAVQQRHTAARQSAAQRTRQAQQRNNQRSQAVLKSRQVQNQRTQAANRSAATASARNRQAAIAQRNRIAAQARQQALVLLQRRRALAAPVRWDRAHRDNRPVNVSLPPRPQSFNFYGNRGWSPDRYRNAQVMISQPTVIQQVSFVSEVPQVSGFRVGFVQYSSGFSSASFSYGSYSYWPYSPCVSSPWYYYPQLPPYLPTSAVYVQDPPTYSDAYDNYNWSSSVDSNAYGPLDYSVYDIQNAFEVRNPSLLIQLVPSDGMVAIYLDEGYRYSVPCSNFRLMLRDCVSDVRTSGYHVGWVRRYHDGSVRVMGQHNVTDPWGHRETVYQSYRLEPYQGRYVVREFGTSHRAFR